VNEPTIKCLRQYTFFPLQARAHLYLSTHQCQLCGSVSPKTVEYSVELSWRHQILGVDTLMQVSKMKGFKQRVVWLAHLPQRLPVANPRCCFSVHGTTDLLRVNSFQEPETQTASQRIRKTALPAPHRRLQARRQRWSHPVVHNPQALRIREPLPRLPPP